MWIKFKTILVWNNSWENSSNGPTLKICQNFYIVS